MANRYCLRVAERLDPAWTAWLGNLALQYNDDGATILTGYFESQVQLFQLLHRMGELGVTLLAVELLPEDAITSPQVIQKGIRQ